MTAARPCNAYSGVKPWPWNATPLSVNAVALIAPALSATSRARRLCDNPAIGRFADASN